MSAILMIVEIKFYTIMHKMYVTYTQKNGPEYLGKLVSMCVCVWERERHVTLQHKNQRFLLMAWWSTSFTHLLLEHTSSIEKKTYQFSYQFYWFSKHNSVSLN
jgi:hypothetical protein